MSNLAPVVIFVYNRLEHTKLTIDALKANTLAHASDVIIYSDGPKNSIDKESINILRNYLSSIDGFRSIKIVFRESNFGLAKNIEEGVSTVVNDYGRVIVLEDDIVTSIYFLEYMNESLDKYINNKKVGSISGCNYPVNLENLPSETYFLRIPLCWGWATWDDRWALFEKDLSKVNKYSDGLIKYINFDSSRDYFIQAKMNNKGKINTWFIFWYIKLAENNMVTLFPKVSLVDNIGFDGSGENCGDWTIKTMNEAPQKVYLESIEILESKIALDAHIRYFKNDNNIFIRVKRYITKCLKKLLN